MVFTAKTSGGTMNGSSRIGSISSAKRVFTTIALVDMFMKEMNGAATIHWFRAYWPTTKVLAMSAKRTPEVMREAVEAGAHGFFPKDEGVAELLVALERIHRKGSYFNDELLRNTLCSSPRCPPR